MGEKDAPLAPALREVRRALDARNLAIPISGPDWTDLPVFDAAKIDFDPFIGAYDIHSYQGIDEPKQKNLEAWVDWARAHDKPLFLTEIGDMRLGWGDTNAGPKSFAAALSNAESILRGLAAGVSAFNRWSFTNRGDLDGQWQLIRTWDTHRKRYLDTIDVEPAAYYGFGIITRFCAKRSSVVATEAIGDPEVFSQTLKSPDGKLTTYILNKSDRERTASVTVTGAGDATLYLYSVTEQGVTQPGYRMEPVKEIVLRDGGDLLMELPARSISTLTGFKSAHGDPARKP